MTPARQETLVKIGLPIPSCQFRNLGGVIVPGNLVPNTVILRQLNLQAEINMPHHIVCQAKPNFAGQTRVLWRDFGGFPYASRQVRSEKYPGTHPSDWRQMPSQRCCLSGLQRAGDGRACGFQRVHDATIRKPRLA